MTKDELIYKSSDKLGSEEAKNTVYISNITTNDDTETIIQTVIIPLGYAGTLKVHIVGIDVNGGESNGETGCFDAILLVRNNEIATAVNGTNTPKGPDYCDTSAEGWRMSFQIPNPSDQVSVTVTGDANKTVNWVCKVEFTILK